MKHISSGPLSPYPRNGHPRLGLNGLAFKSGTDDLRESPIVLIAEHFIGKGYDVKIHDPAIETSMITGTNRDFIERHIPHLSQRLVHSLDELIEHSEVLLITRDGEHLLDRVVALGKRPMIIDLRGQHQFARRLLEAKRRSMNADKEEGREGRSKGNRVLISLKGNGRNGGSVKVKPICKE